MRGYKAARFVENAPSRPALDEPAGRPRVRGAKTRIELALLASLALLVSAGIGRAQTQPPGAVQLVPQAPNRAGRAVPVAQPPNIDGNVLGDPTWTSVEPLSEFRQSAPDEGEPASQRTEVRVVFTTDTIYFGVVLYDDDPSGIIMTDSRRDS